MQGQTGFVPAGTPDGQQPNIRLGRNGEVIKSDHQPRFSEANYRGQIFSGCTQAASVTTVAFATTYVGLCLSNPSGSGKNIHLINVGYSFPVAPAAVSIVGLMTGWIAAGVTTHTTALTPKQSFWSGSMVSPVGLLDAACTLPTTPVLERILGAADTGAVTVDRNVLTVANIDGGIILAPGGYVAIYTSTVANTAGFVASMQWAEMPL
jgi:hypothetical protein